MSEKPLEPLVVEIRDATEADQPFIFDSWRHVYRFRKPRRWDDYTYQDFMTDRMNRLFKRAVTKVAHFPDHPDDLVGWACAEPPLLHYIFVKKVYQGQGVARLLLAHVGIIGHQNVYCTHWAPRQNQVKLEDYITFLNREV